jgi:hypothetical protein
MFMAEKLIITEEVQKQINMAFKMRSGNKVSFKNMGSSPAKNMKTSSYEHSFESPAKQEVSTEKKKFYVDNYEENKDKPGFQEAMDKAFDGETKVDGKTSITTKRTPTKQKLNKGGEGQDQDKIFNDKGEHIGDYVNDKPVMKPGFKRPVMSKKLSDLTPADKKAMNLDKTYPKKSPAKQVKTKGLGPSTLFGGVKNPELVKTKKTKGKKVMKDGAKNRVHGVKNPGNWQPHPDTFKTPMKQDEKWIDRAQEKHDRLTGKIEKAQEKGKTNKVARLTKRRTNNFKKTDARIKAED